MINWGELAKNLLNLTFTILGINVDIGDMGGTVTSLCFWDQIVNSPIGNGGGGITLSSIISKLNDVMVPIGLSILACFAMIDLLKKCMDVERVSWERVAMSLVRFLIFKMLIESSYQLLNMIMTVGQEIMQTVVSVMSASSPAVNSISLGDAVMTTINDASFGNWATDWLAPCLLFIIFFLLWFGMVGTFAAVFAQALKRVVVILLTFSFAPIPLAIGTMEDGSAVGKRFIMQVIALNLEGLLMFFCAKIYQLCLVGVMQADPGDFVHCIGILIAYIALNGFLSTLLSSVGQLAEKWVGA